MALSRQADSQARGQLGRVRLSFKLSVLHRNCEARQTRTGTWSHKLWARGPGEISPMQAMRPPCDRVQRTTRGSRCRLERLRSCRLEGGVKNFFQLYRKCHLAFLGGGGGGMAITDSEGLGKQIYGLDFATPNQPQSSPGRHLATTPHSVRSRLDILSGPPWLSSNHDGASRPLQSSSLYDTLPSSFPPPPPPPPPC